MPWITYTNELDVKVEQTLINGKDGWEVYLTGEEYEEDDASLLFQDTEGLLKFTQSLMWKIEYLGLLEEMENL